MNTNLIEILQILSTPIALRNLRMIQILVEMTKSIGFFEQLIKDLGEKMHFRICEFLNYEYHVMGEVLFKEGDKGDKFYIILQGKVQIVINYNSPNEDCQMESLAFLIEGSSFGELSLIKNQPRFATAICHENTYLMVLYKEDYNRLLGHSFAKKLEEKIEFLHSLKVFSEWSKRSIEKLTFFFKQRHYKKKDLIYAKDDKADGAYIIIKGEIELTTITKSSNNKNLPRALKVALITTKDIFGDEEILLNIPRKYCAHCKSDSAEVFWISRDDFLSKISKESLKQLILRNNARNKMRQYRLKSIEHMSENKRNYSATPMTIKPNIDISLSLIKRFRKREVSQSPKLFISTKMLNCLKKKSGIQMASPTASIIENCVVTSRPRNANVFFNNKGFQPNGNFYGVFKKIQERIRGMEY
ncbi:hypothetical protein SteCoe_4679 [Stentor coeruleus]|uniref:Cyclic nucleotide-binding domain-containing protein n=1 Tax=Stentor coeruleus TaxID=5963 RepID=A0A1R2CU41_9CILI|nr:hypothetical protein SteCoe_4679 [Stentor coeruleus]